MLPLLGLESLLEAATASATRRPSALLAEREQARAPSATSTRADEIRDQLAELGWEVRDTAERRPAASRRS